MRTWMKIWVKPLIFSLNQIMDLAISLIANAFLI